MIYHVVFIYQIDDGPVVTSCWYREAEAKPITRERALLAMIGRPSWLVRIRPARLVVAPASLARLPGQGSDFQSGAMDDSFFGASDRWKGICSNGSLRNLQACRYTYLNAAYSELQGCFLARIPHRLAGVGHNVLQARPAVDDT